jgi:alkylated DNA repair dioxygenase AlkB
MKLWGPELPPGLVYVPDWLSEKEHDSVVREIEQQEFETGLSRRVQHYGARYHYDTSQISEIGSAPCAPPLLHAIGKRLLDERYFERIPEQVIVNEYLQQQGIAAHIDKETFGPKVATVSLLESWLMRFRSLDRQKTIDVLLEKNSLAIMTGESRYLWTHEILKNKTVSVAGLKSVKKRRLSITFRTINV